MKRVVKRLMIAIVAFTLCSCIAPQNAAMVGVDVRSWVKVKSVVYENSDTLSLRNLNIAIRYNDNFEETSLPLKVVIMSPDTRIFEETITLQLLRPSTALAISTTESLPYRTNVSFGQKGTYVFAFKPLTEVRGIEAIGIELKEVD